MLNRRRFLRALLLIAAALAAGCGKPAPPARHQFPETPLSVVTTTVQAADLLRRVGGKAVEVRSLIPPGVNPHLWKPTAAELADAQLADVLVLSGLRLEKGFTENLDALRSRGLIVGVLANALSDGDILAGADGSPDPHFWMSPRLWAKASEEAAEVLIEAFPAGAHWFRDRSHEHRVELEELHEAGLRLFGEVPPRNRFLLTSHDTMAYFAAAFQLECRALASSAGQAPSKTPEDLLQWVRDHRIRTVFRDYSADAQALRSLTAPLTIHTERPIFSLSLAPPGTRLPGLVSEMAVDEYPSATRFTLETIHTVLLSN